MQYILWSGLVLGVLAAGDAAAIAIQPKAYGMRDSQPSADSLLKTADSLFRQQRLDEAFQRYHEAITRAREEFNRPVEAEALAQLARVELQRGNLEKAAQWLAQAAERADESDPMGWSRYLGVKGRLEWRRDDLPRARATFERMYEFCLANALWGRAVDAAHMMAIVAESFEEQVAWGRRGIEMAEKSESYRLLGPLWNNLAAAYYEHGDYDSALTAYRQAREYHWRYSGESAKLFADYHVGMTLRRLGRYEEAASWLRPVLAWAERLGDHSAIGQACEDLGEIALAGGDTAQGLKLLQRARREYRAAGFDTSWPEVWQHITKRLAELEQQQK